MEGVTWQIAEDQVLAMAVDSVGNQVGTKVMLSVLLPSASLSFWRLTAKYAVSRTIVKKATLVQARCGFPLTFTISPELPKLLEQPPQSYPAV